MVEVTIGMFTFCFSKSDSSDVHIYMRPICFGNEVLSYQLHDTLFGVEYVWFKRKDDEDFLEHVMSDNKLKITNNISYRYLKEDKIVEIHFIVDYKETYKYCIVDRESFVVFIKLLLYFYEQNTGKLK